MINKKKLFDDIDPEEAERVLSEFYSRSYKKNHILIFEDSPFEAVYIVKSGLLKVYRSHAGKEVIIDFARPGDIIGEIELFSGNNSIANVEVLEDAELYIISQEYFKRFILNHEEYLMNLLKINSDRIERLNKQVRALSLFSVHSRLCQALIVFSEDLDTVNKDRLVLEGLNQNMLADMIGATRESVSKAFSDLQEEDILTYETNKITILNYRKLKKYSDS